MPPRAEGDEAPITVGGGVGQAGPPLEEAEPANEAVELLLQGARYGDDEDVRAALDAGAGVASTDSQGRTALHMAAANGHLDIVRMLVECQADVNARNIERSTPLHWAAVNGHASVVELLMAHGADPSALNRHERTPVDEAVGNGHLHILDAINAAMALREASSLSVNSENADADED